MISIIQVTCPSCGATIGPDDIHGTIVYCPKCKSYRVLANNRDVLKPVFNKIQRHIGNIIDYKNQMVNLIWKAGGQGVFEEVKPVSAFRRFYLPVREIYNGEKKTILCLNEYDDILHNTPLNGEIPPYITNMLNESDFSDLLSIDFKPIFVKEEEDKIDFLSTDTPIDKIDILYDVKKTEMIVIKYLPITTVDTTIGRLFAIGTNHIFLINPQVISNHMEKVREKKIEKIDKWTIIWLVVIVAILIALCIGIYKFLTMGISFSDFLMGIIAGIVYAIGIFLGIIGLSIVAIAISLTVSIPIHTMCIILKYWIESMEGKGDDLNKGYKVFGIK